MKSSRSIYWLIVCLFFLGLGGLIGGVAMIIKPDGTILQSSLDLLKHSPVKNYFWPGIFLLIFMGLWPLFNIYGLLMRRQWVKISTICLGIVTVLWIIYETITIRTFSPLQPLILAIGLAIILLVKRIQLKKEGYETTTGTT